jgi:hypothetical protein
LNGDAKVFLDDALKQIHAALGIDGIDFLVAVARNVDPGVARNAQQEGGVVLGVDASEHDGVGELGAAVAGVVGGVAGEQNVDAAGGFAVELGGESRPNRLPLVALRALRINLYPSQPPTPRAAARISSMMVLAMRRLFQRRRPRGWVGGGAVGSGEIGGTSMTPVGVAPSAGRG